MKYVNKRKQTVLMKLLHWVFKDKFKLVLVKALFSTFLCLHTSDFGGCPFIINKWWWCNYWANYRKQSSQTRTFPPSFLFFSTNCSLVWQVEAPPSPSCFAWRPIGPHQAWKCSSPHVSPAPLAIASLYTWCLQPVGGLEGWRFPHNCRAL